MGDTLQGIELGEGLDGAVIRLRAASEPMLVREFFLPEADLLFLRDAAVGLRPIEVASDKVRIESRSEDDEVVGPGKVCVLTTTDVLVEDRVVLRAVGRTVRDATHCGVDPKAIDLARMVRAVAPIVLGDGSAKATPEVDLYAELVRALRDQVLALEGILAWVEEPHPLPSDGASLARSDAYGVQRLAVANAEARVRRVNAMLGARGPRVLPSEAIAALHASVGTALDDLDPEEILRERAERQPEPRLVPVIDYGAPVTIGPGRGEHDGYLVLTDAAGEVVGAIKNVGPRS